MNRLIIALIVPLVLAVGCRSTASQSREGTASTQDRATPPGAPRVAGEDPLMRPGPAVKGHAEDQVVSGRIATISPGSVSIEGDRGEQRVLQLVPETSLLLDGRDATFSEVREGQPVRASFTQVDGRDVAVEVHVGRSPLGEGGYGPSSAAGDRSSGAAGPPMHGAPGTTEHGTAAGSAGMPHDPAPGTAAGSGMPHDPAHGTAAGSGMPHDPAHGSASAPGASKEGVAGQDPLMQPGPAIKGHASDQVVSGRIATVSPDSVEIERDLGAPLRLEIVPETSIVRDGQDASFADLKEGHQVRASYNESQGRDVAVEIQVGAPADAGSPAASPQGVAPIESPTQGGSADPSGSGGSQLR